MLAKFKDDQRSIVMCDNNFANIDAKLASCMLQEDATRQLEILQKEIQDSMDELDKIHPFYENQVIKEKEITKGYVYGSQLILQ